MAPGSACPKRVRGACPSGPADDPAAPCLQRLFSDPITYSSLDFSCLDLIILNPLYLIISSPARPDRKLPGGSPAPWQKDNLSPISAPGGAWPAETEGRVMGTVGRRVAPLLRWLNHLRTFAV